MFSSSCVHNRVGKILFLHRDPFALSSDDARVKGPFSRAGLCVGGRVCSGAATSTRSLSVVRVGAALKRSIQRISPDLYRGVCAAGEYRGASTRVASAVGGLSQLAGERNMYGRLTVDRVLVVSYPVMAYSVGLERPFQQTPWFRSVPCTSLGVLIRFFFQMQGAH